MRELLVEVLVGIVVHERDDILNRFVAVLSRVREPLTELERSELIRRATGTVRPGDHIIARVQTEHALGMAQNEAGLLWDDKVARATISPSHDATREQG